MPIFHARKDLLNAFKQQKKSLEEFLINWWNKFGYQEYPGFKEYIFLKSKDNKSFANEKIAITGFHNYQLGISEDARNLYKSIKEITPSQNWILESEHCLSKATFTSKHEQASPS